MNSTYEDLLTPYTTRLAGSKEFLTRLWHLDNDERPGFMIGYVGPEVKGGTTSENVLFIRSGEGTFRDRLLDPEKYLRAQVDSVVSAMNNRGDFIPTITPMIGIVAIPSALGGEIQWWENDLPAVRPAIADVRQVYALEKPALNAGVMGMALDYTRCWVEKTKGRFPIGPVDCQSPLDLAALVLGHNNYLEALYSNPEEIHYLLQLLTETMIDFIQEQRRIVRDYGAEFVPTYNYPWLPDGYGINIAHDENVMISPAMHDKYALPYLNQISEAFNGIFIHSCGRFTHQLPSLAKVYKLRGLEFGASEATYEPVMEYFNGKVVLSVRIGLNQDIIFNSMADFVRRIKKARKTNQGLFIHCDITNGILPDGWPVVDLDEIYALLEG